MPFVSYYFTVNGVPACAAEETLDPRLDPATVCAHATEASAAADAERVRAFYPDATINVLVGPCPQPNQQQDWEEP